MSNKSLLNETQIRKMMKLASLGGTLTSNFLNEKHGKYMDEDEHSMEEGYGMQEDEEEDMEEGHGMMKHGMDEDDHAMEEAHGEMHEDDVEEGYGMYEDEDDKEVLEGEHEEAPEDAGPEDTALDLDAPASSDKETKFASAIATLADLANIDVDFGDMAGMAAADDMGDMGDMAAADDMGDMGDMAADLADMGDEEEPLDEIDFIDEEEVMNEVYKRVKNRLREKLLSDK